jgi:SAM-dependent methyltransferase
VNLVETLREHERAWEERPFVRRLYREWFEAAAARLGSGQGPTVEIGSGLGKLRDVIPTVVLTDVEETPWADAVVDAERLPYAPGEVANLVLVDVFHHLPRPAAFLDEAERVLRPGGRLIMLEPYCSPLASLAYRRLHHEDVDLGADPFGVHTHTSPLDANIALPTLAFYRRDGELARRWPGLELVERRRLSLLAYPLSGGFSKRQLVPRPLESALVAADRLLQPFARLAAFRCLVVLERR